MFRVVVHIINMYFFKKIFLLLFLCLECMACDCSAQGSWGSVRFPTGSIIGSYQLPDMGVGDQTQVFWKSNKCFLSLSIF